MQEDVGDQHLSFGSGSFTPRPLRIRYLGGCHVMGWPLHQSQAFPALMNKMWQSYATEKVANLPFSGLHEHLSPVRNEKDVLVLFQLGNYEFSAEWNAVLKQTLGISSKKKSFVPAVVVNNSEESAAQDSAHTGTSSRTVAKRPTRLGVLFYRMTWLLRCIPQALLYIISWDVFKKNSASFQLLNKSIDKNKSTLFVFLTPFPTANVQDSFLRKIGGWIMRRKIIKRNNVVWIDAHSILNVKNDIFYDASHLNIKGHQILANYLNTHNAVVSHLYKNQQIYENIRAPVHFA